MTGYRESIEQGLIRRIRQGEDIRVVIAETILKTGNREFFIERGVFQSKESAKSFIKDFISSFMNTYGDKAIAPGLLKDNDLDFNSFMVKSMRFVIKDRLSSLSVELICPRLTGVSIGDEGFSFKRIAGISLEDYLRKRIIKYVDIFITSFIKDNESI